MADQPLKRRRWRRWWRRWCLGVVVVFGIGGGWLYLQSISLVRRAKSLRLGMTEAEVVAVMGRPTIRDINGRKGTNSQSSMLLYGAFHGFKRRFSDTFFAITGRRVATTYISDFPVWVSVDYDGKSHLFVVDSHITQLEAPEGSQP